MRILLSWLRDFVDLTEPASEVAGRLLMRGFATEGLEELAPLPLPPWAPEARGSDAVIDIEVTANRPDALSVLGVAREVAAIYGRTLRPFRRRPAGGAPPDALELRELVVAASGGVGVTVEDTELCPRYALATAQVKVGASPAWMQARLAAAGVRPISNIVDVTNYVLIEMGQPLHAFDRDRLDGGELRIRRARRDEVITTLDGADRTLADDMLVIADARRAQAVAGVMGGAASDVSAGTTRVVIESASFTPASVRRTSKRLGLKTEASTRFERGADIGAPGAALERAVALLELVGAGRADGPAVDRYPVPRQPLTVHLRRARLAAMLGVDVNPTDVTRAFTDLGMGVTGAADGWDVVVPTFRVDVVREVDLIEEVGRHYGYDRLPTTFPAPTAEAPPPDVRVPRDGLVRRALTALGFSEAITFGFIEASAAERFSTPQAQAVGVANPLSAKFDTMRPSLVPGLVDSLGHNRRHQRRDVRLFEIGTRFAASGETRGVGLAWTGLAGGGHWGGDGPEVTFFDMKGAVERVADALGVPLRFTEATRAWLEPGQTASIGLAPSAGAPEDGTQEVGSLGRLTPAAAEAHDLPRDDAVYVAELDLDALWYARRRMEARGDGIAPLPRYPLVSRDLSMLVPRTLPAAVIRGTILAVGRTTPAPLVDAQFFDRYEGTGVPAGMVSLSVRLRFQSPDRTLTDGEVQQSFETIRAALAERHGAAQR